MSDLETIAACASCKCSFAIPRELYVDAKRSPNISFYCPYGHSNFFPQGETQAEKLRRERDRLQQRLAEKDDELRLEGERRAAAQRSLTATRAVVTRMKNRVGHGVCPCCTRSFDNLARHMRSQHPNYGAQSETAQ